MTNFHPDTTWLSEYAAGSLSDSQALCITAHLAYCVDCKQHAAALTQVGAMIFNQHSAVSDSTETLNKVLTHIQHNAPHAEHQAPQAEPVSSLNQNNQPADYDGIPIAVQKLVPGGFGKLHWKKIGSRISIAKLNNLGDERNVSLHKLQPGGSVSNHDHHGQEITVVLRGSFSDQDGQYFPGDFLIREPGETHRPSASNNEECLCLSVCDAPVKFTGFFARLLNPLMAYQHKH